MRRTYLVARFDVTDLDGDQRGRLAMQVAVQAETNDDPEFYYPGVPAPEIDWEDGYEDEPRTVLVHLNVGVPEGDNRHAGEIAEALAGVLEVGADDESARGLDVAIVLAEEV